MTANLRLVHGDTEPSRRLRVGHRLDKYRLLGRLGEGGFATVFKAYDTIEDRTVALKIPDVASSEYFQSIEDVQREVRIMASLSHPNILPLKDARFIDEHFVIVSPLGMESLHDRIGRRLARATAIDYVNQMTSALAHAHEKKVLHRDIKPENFILFPEGRIQLTDFGLARIQRGAQPVSASGTLGYISPEQAMGKPTYRSDVFSLGLVIYRMLSGVLPEYPFEQPLPAYNKLRRGLHSTFVDWLRKAIDPKPQQRFRDAIAMRNSLQRIRRPFTGRSGSTTPSNRATTRRVRRAA